MVASIEERARRRKIDFERMGIKKDVTEIIAEITERDRKDSTRRQSPLKKADDAVEIDTTHLSIDEQVAIYRRKGEGAGFTLSISY